MNPIVNFLGRHTIWDTVILIWVFVAAVGALPAPSAASSGFYRWLYQFLTTIAGRVDDMIQERRRMKTAARQQQSRQSYEGGQRP